MDQPYIFIFPIILCLLSNILLFTIINMPFMLDLSPLREQMSDFAQKTYTFLL